MALGKRIKDKRESAGMTQQQLADKIGKSQSYINSLETRDSKKTDHSEEIARALGVSHYWLTTGNDDQVNTISENKASYGSSHEPVGALDYSSVEFALAYLELAKDDPEFQKYLGTDWPIRAFIKLYDAASDEDTRALNPKKLLRLVS